jgi:hypothetical protein
MSAISATSTANRARPDIANLRAGATKSKTFGMPAAALGVATPSVGASGDSSGPARSEPNKTAASLAPATASTVDFAQKREGGAHHVHGGSPPPAAASVPADDANASPADRAAADLDALMNDLAALTSTSTGSTSTGSTDTASSDTANTIAGSSDLQTAATQIKNDFGSFVDSVLKQYSQTASTGSASDFAGLAATA